MESVSSTECEYFWSFHNVTVWSRVSPLFFTPLLYFCCFLHWLLCQEHFRSSYQDQCLWSAKDKTTNSPGEVCPSSLPQDVADSCVTGLILLILMASTTVTVALVTIDILSLFISTHTHTQPCTSIYVIVIDIIYFLAPYFNPQLHS